MNNWIKTSIKLVIFALLLAMAMQGGVRLVNHIWPDLPVRIRGNLTPGHKVAVL